MHATHSGESYRISPTRRHTAVEASKSCVWTIPTMPASRWRGPEQITSGVNTVCVPLQHHTHHVVQAIRTLRKVIAYSISPTRRHTLPSRRPNCAHGPSPRCPHRDGVFRSRLGADNEWCEYRMCTTCACYLKKTP